MEDQETKIPSKKNVISSSLFTSNTIKTNIPETETKSNYLPSNGLESSESLINSGISELLAQHLSTKMNIKTLAPIQKLSVPAVHGRHADTSHDVIIQAQTGSGKTLA